jgi:hypothetical protein
VIAALVPLPVIAGEKDVSTRAPETPPSISAALARELASTTVPRGELGSSVTSKEPLSRAIARDLTPARSSTTARRSAQSTPGTESPSFFKTPTGAVVLAVMAIGVGYAIYSAQHDRIHSPGKE